jgi:PAS domain S-box-containing protein
MALQPPFGDLEPSRTQRPNQELARETSAYGSKLEEKSLINLISERTSDLIGITTFSLSPRYVYISPSNKRILGYNPSDLLDKCPFDFIHPDDLPKLFPLLEKYVTLLSQPGKASGELKLPTERLLYRFMDKSGNWRSLETTGDLIADDRILFISRDVTERVKAEHDLYESRMLLQTEVETRTRELTSANAALRESERRYRNILESIEDGYYEVDLAGNMTFFNDALCRMTGYSPEELRGMNNREYTEPEMAKRMFEIFNRVHRTGESSRIDDYVVIKKDGAKCTVQLSTSLIRDLSGNAVGFRGIARDVTERRLARRALEESEEKYRTILQSIEDGYYEVDIKGNFVFFNESMCKILGYSSQELNGMNNRHFMSEETSKKVFQTFNQVYRNGEPAKALGWELIRKDGERRYVETSISLIATQKEEPTGFRGIARDITEQKALEKARERIINHLSHELGTPLSILEGMLARIPDELKKKNFERLSEWSKRGLRNVRRLKDLKSKIDDILNGKPTPERERILDIIEGALSLLDELKKEPLKEGAEEIRQGILKQLESLYEIEDTVKEDITLDTFLDEVLQEAISSLKGRQLDIVKDFEQGIFLQMDRKILKKACEGLLRNAIENTPDDGRIEIKTKCEDDFVRIDFRDFGVGILPENQKMIFGGFFHTQDTHLYASRKPYEFNAGGSGVDLLRTKIFSERFGFSVDFHSTRCRYLPSDRDECPGRVSSCPFIKSRDGCQASGSLFSLIFSQKIFFPPRKQISP